MREQPVQKPVKAVEKALIPLARMVEGIKEIISVVRNPPLSENKPPTPLGIIRDRNHKLLEMMDEFSRR